MTTDKNPKFRFLSMLENILKLKKIKYTFPHNNHKAKRPSILVDVNKYKELIELLKSMSFKHYSETSIYYKEEIELDIPEHNTIGYDILFFKVQVMIGLNDTEKGYVAKDLKGIAVLKTIIAKYPKTFGCSPASIDDSSIIIPSSSEAREQKIVRIIKKSGFKENKRIKKQDSSANKIEYYKRGEDNLALSYMKDYMPTRTFIITYHFTSKRES